LQISFVTASRGVRIKFPGSLIIQIQETIYFIFIYYERDYTIRTPKKEEIGE